MPPLAFHATRPYSKSVMGGGENRAEHGNETQRAPRISRSDGHRLASDCFIHALYRNTTLHILSEYSISPSPHRVSQEFRDSSTGLKVLFLASSLYPIRSIITTLPARPSRTRPPKTDKGKEEV